MFLYFFEPEEILGLATAPWLSSSLGLLNLKKTSLAGGWVVLCSTYIFSSTLPRDLTENLSRVSEGPPYKTDRGVHCLALECKFQMFGLA